MRVNGRRPRVCSRRRDTPTFEMTIEGGAGDLERLGTVLADQDVDDALGGSLVFLAFAAEADGSL